MRGPGERITLTFAAPTGVNLTGRTVTLASTYDGAPVSDWSEVSRTADAISFSRVPSGTEFPTARAAIRVHHELTIDGELYRYEPTDEPVKEY